MGVKYCTWESHAMAVARHRSMECVTSVMCVLTMTCVNDAKV